MQVVLHEVSSYDSKLIQDDTASSEVTKVHTNS